MLQASRINAAAGDLNSEKAHRVNIRKQIHSAKTVIQITHIFFENSIASPDRYAPIDMLLLLNKRIKRLNHIRDA